LVEAETDQQAKKPQRLARRIQRERSRGPQGSSCSCCLGPATTAHRRGSNRCNRRCFLPASLWATGPSLARNIHVTTGRDRPARSCNGGDGGSRSRKGRQGLLVAAAQWAAALAGHRRYHRRARDFLPAPFRAAGSSSLRGILTSGTWISEGRHGQFAL
jgi:hypothetical protein